DLPDLPARREPTPTPTPAESARQLTFGTREIGAAEVRSGRELRSERRGYVPPNPGNLPPRRSTATVPATHGSRALAPTGNEAGAAILSASELAAVFQLDAPKPSFIRRTGRFAWRATKVTFVVGLFLVAAGSVAAYLRPDWA